MYKILFIQPAAPPKPAVGAPCNGCGICCLAEPCPIGILLSRRRHGACLALYWSPERAIYRCGALDQPLVVLANALPRFLRTTAPWLAPLLARFARRWIAAGLGCDSSLEPQSPTIAAP